VVVDDLLGVIHTAAVTDFDGVTFKYLGEVVGSRAVFVVVRLR